MSAQKNRPTEDEAASHEFGGSGSEINTELHDSDTEGAGVELEFLTRDEILLRGAELAVERIAITPLSALGNACVRETERVVSAENLKRKNLGVDRLAPIRELEAVQAAALLQAKLRIVEVTPSGVRSDSGLGILAIYQQEGDFEGVYLDAENGLLDELAGRLRPSGHEGWHKEVRNALRRTVTKASEVSDPDLIPMHNCWFNYRTGERIVFSPELVTLAKFATELPERQPPVPRIVNPDGTSWDASEWIAEVTGDPDTLNLTYQVIGMCFRPNVVWRVMVYLKGVGLNGKGTLLELIRAMVGAGLTVNIPPSKFGEQFALGPAIGKRLNLVDEDDVGKRVEEGSKLKQVISHDPVPIERKYRDPVTAILRMSILVSVNETQSHKDLTQAMTDRQVLIEFPGRFVGGNRNEAIKNDYVTRADVREWFAYHVLIALPKYYKLLESDTAKAAKRRAMLDSDKILAFHDEYVDQFERDFLPFAMLYDLYVATERRNNPRGSVEAARTFTPRLKRLMDGGEWVVPAGTSKDLELGLTQWIFGTEPVLAEYSHVPEVSNWDWDFFGSRPNGQLTKWMQNKRKARGFVRRAAWERFQASGATPYGVARGVA
ncbi:phage/plasmid primase, P4 family [Curtobacterium sp. MCSS17_005]|uniref:phage/plasmid primase, P4 family n=1 Tax=Curtobacterium sp. MCSS17_005 TaxID=2175641 RepID=UPI000DAA49F6|nr:phage/plasmid primase, P4 family [Curtobacterium sp. MCSS17_005]WIB34430.1 phage/plasmid primase, P4 family [Curtobacterium sp. MCSS17_005]